MSSNDLPESPPWICVAPMRTQLIRSYHQCLDSVCREKLYLMMPEAPPLAMSDKFIRDLLADDMPMTVALAPGPKVIGWCDIYRVPYHGQEHVGRLGLGVRSGFRGQGIGGLLLSRSLKAARTSRLERVELEVFGSNRRAIDLYRRFEFQEEGLKRRARKMNGVYEDIMMMALHL